MLRRRTNAFSVRGLQQLRFGGGAGKTFNHAPSFARPLTQAENVTLAEQSKRTVSRVIPGKVFMRHWLAGEQATVSILNRSLSVAITGILAIGATFHLSRGNSAFNSAHLSIYVCTCIWLALHTHQNMLYVVFLVPYLFMLAN